MKTIIRFAAALLVGLSLLSCSENSKIPVIPSGPTDDEGGESGTYVEGKRQPVFYEANPRVFASDKSFNAIQARLDEIKALGTDIIWLMPVNTLGVEKAIGSPYCIKDYKGLNPSFGTMSDLKNLVSEAHNRGMKVILDWVANHTSWDNVWIAENKDWYTQENGVIISPKGMGWSDVADLNYGSSEMRAAMTDAMLYWLREADVDGFRCDYAEGVPDDFWKSAIDEIHRAKSEAVMLAESSDKKFLNLGFDWIYGWPYQSALAAFFPNGNAKAFISNVEKELSGLTDKGHIMRFTTNHDQASEGSPVSVYGSAEGALAAFATTAFIGQSPLIYSSQEIGYAQKLSFFENKPMQWDSNKSYTDSYKKIMKIYGDTAAIRNGNPTLYSTSAASVLVAYYPNGDKALVFVVNASDKNASADMPSGIAGKSVTDLMTGSNTTIPANLSLKAFEYKLYQK